MRFVSGVTVRGHSRLFPVTGTDAWLEAGGWSPWGAIAAEFFAFSCSHAARVSTSLCAVGRLCPALPRPVAFDASP